MDLFGGWSVVILRMACEDRFVKLSCTCSENLSLDLFVIVFVFLITAVLVLIAVIFNNLFKRFYSFF